MKLLEILQKELKEFPEGMLYAVQDDDGEVKFGKYSQPTLWSTGIWNSESEDCPRIRGLELAEDWDSVIVTKDMWERGKMKSKTTDSLQSKHKHAEMIALCAEFAQTMKNPMMMFQFKDRGAWVDFDLNSNLAFYNHREYRLKPKTHTVHGVEIPDLRVAPKIGERYYLADPTEPEFTHNYESTRDNCDTVWTERSLCYENTEAGKQAAILHAKAMLGIA